MTFQKKTRIPIYGKLKNFVIHPELDQGLSRMAEEKECSVSSLIRRFCREGLEREMSTARTPN